MTVLQLGLNLLAAVVMFALAKYVLALAGVDDGFGWFIAFLIGVGTFFANPARNIKLK